MAGQSRRIIFAPMCGVIAFAAVVLFGAPACGDLAKFKDGSEVEGEVSLVGTMVVIKTASGTIIRERKDLVQLVRSNKTRGAKRKTYRKPARSTPFSRQSALHSSAGAASRTRSTRTRAVHRLHRSRGKKDDGPVDLLSRFRLEHKAVQLMLLAARTGRVIKLKEVEVLLQQHLGMASERGQSPESAIEELIDGWKLAPEHTREKVQQQIKEFQEEWGARATVLKSRHYHVLTNNGLRFAKLVALRMDGIFEEYQRRLVFKERITERFVVKVYKDRASYLGSGAPGMSAAYYSASDRALVGYDSDDGRRTFAALQHEGCHQFLHFYVPDPPTWFDEGLAQYFETATPRRAADSKGRLYNVGLPHKGNISAVKRALQRESLVTLRKLTHMSRAEYYMRAHVCYPQGWALTYFLLETGHPRFKRLWRDYFFALRAGKTTREANTEVFAGIDWSALDELFARWIKQIKRS